MKQIHPILLTGTIRSGSTWSGKVLSWSSKIKYIGEPFAFYNEKDHLGTDFIRRYFPYFTEKELFQYRSAIGHAMGLSYNRSDIIRHLKHAKTFRNHAGIIKRFTNHHLEAAKKTIPLVKDPHVIFSSEILHKAFNTKNIILIRHPAAVISSLKRMEWQVGANIYQKQPALIADLIPEMKDEIWNFKNHNNAIEEGILYWNIVHTAINKWRNKYPDWCFIRHEDLSNDPINEFQKIFKFIGISFTKEIQLNIEQSTHEKNPVEANKGELHTMKRNSKKNIHSWKNRLNREEIERIKKGTQHIASFFYNENDW